ncbi:MAG: MFS transporter, partial [Ktedonobacterales bacterium]
MLPPALRRRGDAHAAPPLLLRATLLSTALLDELTFGFLVVALPLLRDSFHLSYVQAGLLFTIGELASLVLDPPINLLADHISKRIPVLGGMLALIVGFVFAAAAPSYAALLVAFALIYPAIGAAVGLAQAALIDTAAGDEERAMTRWTVLSAVGDLLAPLTVGAGVALGLRWPLLCLVAATLWLAVALVFAPQRLPRPVPVPDGSGQDERPVLRELRAALGDRALLRWLAISLLATTLDEVFLAFAALYLHDRLHVSLPATSFALAVAVGVGLLTLLVLARIQTRMSGRRLLPAMALIALAGIAILLVAPSLPLATLGLSVA